MEIDRLSARVDVDTARANAKIRILDRNLDNAAEDRTARIKIVEDDKGNLFFNKSRRQGFFREMIDGFKRLTGVLGGGGGSGAAGGAASTVSGAMSGVSKQASQLSENFTGLGQTVSGGGGGLAKGMTSLGGAAASAGAGLAVIVGIVLFLAPAIASLATAILALGAYLVGLVAAFTPLVGLLGLLPGLALGAGGAIAVLMGAFQGLLPAIQEVIGAEEESEERKIALTSATRSLDVAERAHARAIKEMATARRDAAEAMEDAQFAARSAQLGEERAVIALERAYQRLADVQGGIAGKTEEITKVTDDFTGKQFEVARITVDAARSQEDVRDALLGVKEAELGLEIARDRREDTELDLREIMAKGIEQSDIMIARTQALADAEWALEEARRARIEAEEAVSGRGDAYNDLAPAAQTFVDLVAQGLYPIWESFQLKMQEVLLPHITDVVNQMLPYLEEMEDVLAPLAEGLGTMISSFGDNFFTDENWDKITTFFEEFGEDMGELGPIFAGIATGMLDLIIASQPLVDAVMLGLEDFTNMFQEWAAGDSSMGDLEPWFEQTGEVLKSAFAIMFNLMEFVTGFLKASEGFTDWVLQGLVDATQSLSDWANSDEGAESIGGFFERMIPALEALSSLMGALLGGFVEVFSSTEAVDLMVTFAEHLRDELFPVIFGLFDMLIKTGFLSSLVDFIGSLLMNTAAWWDISQIDVLFTLLSKVMDFMTFFIDFTTGIFQLMGDMGLDEAGDVIMGWLEFLDVDVIMTALSTFFQALPGHIRDWITIGFENVSFEGIWDALLATFDAVLMGIGNAFESVINGVIGVINSTLNGIDVAAGPFVNFGEIGEVEFDWGNAATQSVSLSPQNVERGSNLVSDPSQFSQQELDFIGQYGGNDTGDYGWTINNTFNETVDPHEVSNQIVWDLGGMGGVRPR